MAVFGAYSSHNAVENPFGLFPLAMASTASVKRPALKFAFVCLNTRQASSTAYLQGWGEWAKVFPSSRAIISKCFFVIH